MILGIIGLIWVSGFVLSLIMFGESFSGEPIYPFYVYMLWFIFIPIIMVKEYKDCYGKD